MGFVDKNIRKPEDIKGKTVAITPADSMTQIWPLFLKKTGLKESDFQTVAGDGQTKLNAVINGQADLLLGYVMDQSMKIKDATGKDVYPIKFADYGINMVSSGIIANTDYVKANADLVRRFMSATTKAVEAAEKEPKAAAQSILDANPKGGKIDTLTQGFELTIPLYRTAGDQGQAAVPGHRPEHDRLGRSDGRIWRPRRQGQGQSEGVLHQRLSAEGRFVKRMQTRRISERCRCSPAAHLRLVSRPRRRRRAGHQAVGRVEDLPVARRRCAVAAAARLPHQRRRVLRRGRAVRLRQVHAAQDDLGPAAADDRRGAGRGRDR